MDSILRFSLADIARRRADLTIRPMPEISLCMVYRPRPARIITLNLSCWLLLELCDGSRIADVLGKYVDALTRRGRRPRDGDAESGLQSLIDQELVSVSSSS
jgi:hypothetical protein